MLPNDRAPGLPTQYAGEPTFLCLGWNFRKLFLNIFLYYPIISFTDPNIPETGKQLERSNSGPDSCCYRYCSASVYDGICSVCDHEPQLQVESLGSGSDDEGFAEQCPFVELTSAQSPSGCLTPFQAASKSAASSVWRPHRTIANNYFHLSRKLLGNICLPSGKSMHASWQSIGLLMFLSLMALTIFSRFAHCNAAVIAIYLITVQVSS